MPRSRLLLQVVLNQIAKQYMSPREGKIRNHVLQQKDERGRRPRGGLQIQNKMRQGWTRTMRVTMQKRRRGKERDECE